MEACFSFWANHSSYIRSLNSIAPPPQPSITPMFCRVARSAARGSSLASRNASSAAATAMGTTRDTCRMFFESTHCSGWKSTSPAMRQGSSEAPGSERREVTLPSDSVRTESAETCNDNPLTVVHRCLCDDAVAVRCSAAPALQKS